MAISQKLITQALFYLENNFFISFLSFFQKEIAPIDKNIHFKYFGETHSFLTLSVAFGYYYVSFELINSGIDYTYVIPETKNNIMHLACASGNWSLIEDLTCYFSYNNKDFLKEISKQTNNKNIRWWEMVVESYPYKEEEILLLSQKYDIVPYDEISFKIHTFIE